MSYIIFNQEKTLKVMARLREFDTDRVMEAVIDAFWERGYEATSLADLMAVTGLKKGSIYKAFGDKHSLFLQALQTYLDRLYSLTSQALNNPNPEEAISNWFQILADTAVNPQGNKGCFALNSTMELAPHDPDVARMLEYQYSRVGKLLEKALVQGQQTGVFRQDLSAKELRQMLLVTANGILASSRAEFLRSDLPQVTKLVLKVLKT
jgi:TetR/AcrR family transcriptional regulator, transcriptional repressor for nem operon